MRGQISISLQREPDYFADAKMPGEEKQAIVARKGGRVICVGSCAIRQRFVNGKTCRVGYLGGLRLDASVAGRFDILRRGYEFFHELQAKAPADFYFTSIASDNHRARKFLERGLTGMPRYEFIGEFVTLQMTSSRRSRRDTDSNRSFDEAATTELIHPLNAHNLQRQFAARWSGEELTKLRMLGLRACDFHAVCRDDRIAACAALWDQRCFKQTVIRGYAPWLAATRPALNILARIFNSPRLPVAAEPISSAFVSHLISPTDDQEVFLALIAKLRAVAKQRDIELLTLGFAVNDPHLATVRRHFRCREYRSRLYVVRWSEMGGAARELDGRVLAPEVALL